MKIDKILVLGVIIVTVALAVSLLAPTQSPAATVATAPSLSKPSTGKQSTPTLDGTAEIDLSPTVIRKIQVIRDGKVVHESIKVGDPITVQWYKLVANWMFALYYKDRQTVYDITGTDSPGFDSAAYGMQPILHFFVSNSTDPVGFESYTVTPFYEGSVDQVLDASNTTHYVFEIVGTYRNALNETITVTKVGLLLEYDSSTSYSVYKARLLFIVDEINPPVTLQPDDAITVTWEIAFPQQEPYTAAHFWRILKTFMGGDNYPDFGSDGTDCGSCLGDDNLRETIAFAVYSDTGTLMYRGAFDDIRVWTNSSGLYIELIGHYSPDTTINVSRIDLELYSDSTLGGGFAAWSGYYFKIFTFSYTTPITVDFGNTLYIRLTIKFANLFGG
jgi:hypothetical protein